MEIKDLKPKELERIVNELGKAFKKMGFFVAWNCEGKNGNNNQSPTLDNANPNK